MSQFEKSMNGPLNYYRTTPLRFEEEKGELDCLATNLNLTH